ncbi:MAG: hypothetical protein ACI837_002467 [Crocinitomicaceae bacterium]|jgi:hypothetical protein
MSKSGTPYLSFVATSRNDDHGGDMRKRMNIFVNGLIHQCNKFKLPCELVMVDWNSPDENELLDKVLPKVTKDDYLSIRYIVVPREIHNKYEYSERLGLYQMIAKNVGIRRAHGEFVVCTNVDLLFSNEMFELFAKRELKQGSFYRANRCDIPNSIKEDATEEEQLIFCKNNIEKRLGKHSRYPLLNNTERKIFRQQIWRPFYPLLSLTKRLLLGKTRASIHRLDFDACGDFTMMSKDDWIKIEGYAELELYSLHIDSMGVFEAAARGLKQEIMSRDECTYHISHRGGWEFADPIEKLHFYAKRPSLEWWSVWVAGNKIVKEKSTFGINDSNWGLNQVELKEITVV